MIISYFKTKLKNNLYGIHISEDNNHITMQKSLTIAQIQIA